MLCSQTVSLDLSQTTIMFIIVLDILMVDQIFLLPQVKRSVIISNRLVYTSCLVYAT